jgi:predicted transposase/invertase (TIGR01784 family)
MAIPLVEDLLRKEIIDPNMRTGDDVYYLSPGADFIFRYLFTMSVVLTSFVNSVIELYNDRSNEIISIDPNIYREIKDGRAFILDVKGRDEKARHFNVESQRYDDGTCDKRFLVYWAGTHARQLVKNQSCGETQKTISILLLWYDDGSKNDNYLGIYRINGREGDQRRFEDFEIYVINLSKFNKTIDELETLLDVWLYFLVKMPNHKVNKDFPEIFQRYPEVIFASQTLKSISLNTLSRVEHDSWLNYSMDFEKRVQKAAEERGEIRGETRGIAIGEKKGRQEGLLHGLLNLIHLKFGDIPPEFLPTIERMSQEQLSSAYKRIFDAKTLDELLGYPDELRDISNNIQFSSIQSH